jgi:hypothetical protein
MDWNGMQRVVSWYPTAFDSLWVQSNRCQRFQIRVVGRNCLSIDSMLGYDLPG